MQALKRSCGKKSRADAPFRSSADYVDREIPLLHRMFEKRLRGYRAIGYARDSVPAGYEEANTEPVQALPDHRGHVLPPRGQRRRVIDLPGGRGPDLVIDRHDEAQGFGMVLDDEDRPGRFVEALDDAPAGLSPARALSRAFKASASPCRAPTTSTNRDFLAGATICSGEQAEVSAEQSVIFGVAPDPEPDETVINLDRKGAVPAPYPHRPDVFGLLEPKGRVPRILLEALESMIGEPLDLWREVTIRGPELRRGVMSQRGVVLPAA